MWMYHHQFIFKLGVLRGSSLSICLWCCWIAWPPIDARIFCCNFEREFSFESRLCKRREDEDEEEDERFCCGTKIIELSARIEASAAWRCDEEEEGSDDDDWLRNDDVIAIPDPFFSAWARLSTSSKSVTRDFRDFLFGIAETPLFPDTAIGCWGPEEVGSIPRAICCFRIRSSKYWRKRGKLKTVRNFHYLFSVPYPSSHHFLFSLLCFFREAARLGLSPLRSQWRMNLSSASSPTLSLRSSPLLLVQSWTTEEEEKKI